MPVADLDRAEYEALRATIRERGTMRIYAVLGGVIASGALLVGLLAGQTRGTVTLVPLLILAATFEVNFFVHTGVERIGRYIQVFYEEASSFVGWESTAMTYGTRFPGGMDPLFARIFFVALVISLLTTLVAVTGQPGLALLSLLAHLAFAYRIVTAGKSAATQRAHDLARFRELRK